MTDEILRKIDEKLVRISIQKTLLGVYDLKLDEEVALEALRVAVTYIESNRLGNVVSSHDETFNNELDEALEQITTILGVKEGEK